MLGLGRKCEDGGFRVGLEFGDEGDSVAYEEDGDCGWGVGAWGDVGSMGEFGDEEDMLVMR